MMALMIVITPAKQLRAQVCPNYCDVFALHHDLEVDQHEKFLVSVFFEDNILPAMQLMAEQLTISAMHHVGVIGTFFDAKHQMESQRLLQNLQATAHKDYHPSVGMCEFGSNIKSLAASERKGEVNAVLLSQRSLDRQLGAANTSAAEGPQQDFAARMDQFKKTYCDPQDSNNNLGGFCNTGSSNEQRARFNKDIDFVRTVSLPWTLSADFTDGALDAQGTEEDIFALASNLYSHEVFSPPSSLADDADGVITEAQQVYLDMRALTAKRSVAETSFNAIVGMKSEGSGGSKEFMAGILEELGIEDADMTDLIGEKPSYHAQMEILTKKIYQNPDFYTNLYDKPANVSRKGVAMQAIGLMQKFDMLKSTLRKEASLSILLELAVSEQQDEILKDTGG